MDASLDVRAARHAAMGDVTRLAIIDKLALSDRAPVELRHLLGLESNLLAHHLDVLARTGLISRRRSTGDGRRRYLHLERGALGALAAGRAVALQPALFVCTHNSARSQLAAALWERVTGRSAMSAGTEPAVRVHPGAVASARRIGLDLSGVRPRSLAELATVPALVVTVCDRAHEELHPGPEWLHWSVPDPAPVASRAAFDAARDELRARISELVDVAV